MNYNNKLQQFSECSFAFLDNKLFKECHCPFIISHEIKNKLYMVFYAGQPEGEAGCGIWFSSFCLENQKWEDAQCIAVDPELCFQNPIIHLDNDVLYLFYTSQSPIGLGECQKTSHIERKVSFDLGNSWSNAEIVIPKGTGCYLRHNILFDILDKNTWLLPVYYTPDGEFVEYNQYSALLESNDKGITWRHRSTIPLSDNAMGIQGSFCYMGNNIVGVFRNRHYVPITISISYDNGHSFQPACKISSSLLSNNSGLCIVPINDKELYLFHNYVEDCEYLNIKRNNINKVHILLKNLEEHNMVPEIIDQKIIINHNIMGLYNSQRISYPHCVIIKEKNQENQNKIHLCFTFKRETIGHYVV